MKNFWVWVDDDRVRVRFVGAAKLGTLETGHQTGGDYLDRVIRLPRYETRRSMCGALFHELGHYLYDRSELSTFDDLDEEQIVDLLAWLPAILVDPRNGPLRTFLGISLKSC